MKKAIMAGAVLLLGGIGFFVLSPYVAVNGLKGAIEAGDPVELEERVDFENLRQSLKDQLNAVILKQGSKDLEENPFNALALAFASKFVEGAVDAYVTPAGLATLARGQQPEATSSGGDAEPPAAPPPASAGDSDGTGESRADELFRNARFTRDSLSRFSVWVADDQGDESQFVFRREGLRWRLSSIQLPLSE